MGQPKSQLATCNGPHVGRPQKYLWPSHMRKKSCREIPCERTANSARFFSEHSTIPISVESRHCSMVPSNCFANLTTVDFTINFTKHYHNQILNNPNHVLAHLLPEKASTHYKLRPRQHDRQLIFKTT